MALADNPPEMIARMFYLQAKEGFSESCQAFPDGMRSTQLNLKEPIFGIFRNEHFFLAGGIHSTAKKDIRYVPWSSIRSSRQMSRGRKDILVVTGCDGTEIEIDLSHPAGTRPAMRIVQLVETLGERWSTSSVSGFPVLAIENFFAAAKQDDDFAVNVYPHPPLEDFRLSFEALLARPDIDDVKVILGDPEEEGDVYADAIAVVSSSHPEVWAHVLPPCAGAALPADANTKRKLGLPELTDAWVVRWS